MVNITGTANSRTPQKINQKFACCAPFHSQFCNAPVLTQIKKSGM